MRNRVIAIALIAAVCAGCQQHNKTGAVKRQYGASKAKLYLPLSQEQYQRGEYDNAAESAKLALDTEPGSAKANIAYGKALLALGRNDEADTHFMAAIQSDVTLDEAWYGRALAAMERGNSTAASTCFETAITLNPANVEAIKHLTDLYLASGNDRKAILLLEKALPENPDIRKTAATTYLRLNMADKAVLLYESLCQENKDDLQLAETLGYAYMDAGRQKDAAALFEMLCEKTPAAASTYVSLAAGCYMRVGSYKDVVRLSDKYAAACKDNTSFWVTMGQAALGMHDAARALYSAKRAVAIEPANQEARTLLGCAQYADGKYADAADTLDRIGDSGNSFVWVMKGRCYGKLGDKTKAASALDKALRLDPQNAAATRLVQELALGTGEQKQGPRDDK
jgi:tetratricopeptide (TPR) repeat protein